MVAGIKPEFKTKVSGMGAKSARRLLLIVLAIPTEPATLPLSVR
jgi:hypothetical protein